MAKKKDEITGSADASVLRRSGREIPSRKQTTSSPVNSRKSERFQKQASPNPSPVKNKLEKVEKQMESSPLRRSDRGKKSVEMTELPNKSTKEKTANNSKQSSENVTEDKKIEKQNSDVGGRKRKKYDAYKALFKSQRIRTEPDVDKELKHNDSIRVQAAPSKDHNALLEGRVIVSDQVEHGDCLQTKSLDGKSVEIGDVEKKIAGDVSPSNGNIANSDNHMSHTSSHRIEHNSENQQEHDTCHKVTETCQAAGNMENAENNDVSSNTQNSKFVEFWVPVQISNVQLEQYCATLLSNDTALRTNSRSDTLGALKDLFVTIRKCCNHPYTVDPEVNQLLMKDKDQSMVVDVGTKASGKLHFLDHILPQLQKQQRKVLILFQPTSGVSSNSLLIGDILADFVYRRFGQDSYELVDGVPNTSTKKQAAVNMFNKDMTKFIFLLESRACHQSIKLSSVDAIIVFDSDINPLNDLKSLQRLSIDSQSEHIMIFRLYSLSTLEEKILKLAENNVALGTRSQNLRSNYDALLTWGASDLFDKLTKFHSQPVACISSEESFLKDVVEEFLYILSHKSKSKDTTSKSVITQVQNCGLYGKSNPLHSEIKTHLPDGDQPYIFWKKLLEGRLPAWKFVSQSTPRQRKRPNYFLEGKSDIDGGGGVKTRRKTVNNGTIEPAQLKTVIEGETGGVNAGVSAATNESQSSSGDQFWSTTVNDETSMYDLLKPTVSELCDILKFSEDVKIIVEKFLEYVLENFIVGKDDTSILQAFMISLCWIGSSLAKYKIDRSESFALAKKHFDFSCKEEQAETVYKKLKQVKETFLEHTQVLPALKDSVPAPERVEKSQHMTNVDVSDENVSRKGVDAFEKINREWDEKRASLENEYKVEKALIHVLYSNPSLRSEKLEIKEREFANKFKEHDLQKRLWEDRLKELTTTRLATEGPVVADNNFSLHGSQHENQVADSGNAEVAPTLPENTIEAQSQDEPVCEGANDIESTGSHTSEKEMADAASSEQIGAPAQQHGDDDMDVDVAEKADSGHDVAEKADSGHDVAEKPDSSHENVNLASEDPVEDHNETGANDVAPHVDCGDVEMPAGNDNKENDEEGALGPDENDHSKTCATDMAQHAYSGDVEMPAGNDNKENDDNEENNHETGANDMAPHVDTGDIEMPAGNCNKENDECGTVDLDTSHVVEDHHKTIDVAPEVESVEMATPAGTCGIESPEEGEIQPDTPDASGDQNETSPNNVLPCVVSAEVATPADNEENAEDNITRPDALHANEDHNDSCGFDSGNTVGAAIPQEKSPSVQPVSSPASDHLEPIIPDSGVPDKDIDVGNPQPPGVSQLDQMIVDDELDIPTSTGPVCAAVSQDKTPSAQPVSSPASDRVEPIIPEIQNDPLQLEQQLPDNGVQDKEINVGNLQPSGASQRDQIIPDNEPDIPSSTDPMVDQIIPDNEPDIPSSTDPTVAENLSDTLPPSEPLIEPTCEEPVENSEENPVPASEPPHEEQQLRVATSVAPTPPVNALNIFDTIANRVSPQKPNHSDPLQAEVERLSTAKDTISKCYQEMKQRLDTECNKEIAEVVAQIRLKYEAKHQETDAAYNSKTMELETNINRVTMNKILAEAFKSKCQDVTFTGHSVSQAGIMQQLHRLSARHYHNASSSSPPQTPPLLPQPPPLPQSQLRPQLPLQIVHQPAALFSSTPSRTPSPTLNRPPSNTGSLTAPSRPPPAVDQLTSSTPPTTTTRPPPIVNQVTPTTPTTSRPPPGINMSNHLSALHKRPPSIAQFDMSAANLRISTETRRQSPHIRPLVSSEPCAPAPNIRPSSEPRAPPPNIRPLLGSEPRAPPPHLRPLVNREPRAPAPHMRSLASTEIRARAPHLRSTPSVTPDAGTHRRVMLQCPDVTSGPSQSPVTPLSTSSPQTAPVEPLVQTQPSDNLNGLADSAPPPRWVNVNVTAPQRDLRSQNGILDVSDYVREGTAPSSSAHDLVCLSDDD
ncbi:putative DNA helicase [Helianthus annuus]|nr:putative DNA helicase [Helianthus annuus]